jgi:hypothetical protein
MNRTTAAVLIALAFTTGNIAATYAGDVRLKPSQRTIQLQPKQNTPQPSGGMNLQAKPFPANCVAGFQKYNEQKTMKGGVPVVSRFDCRTAWIECPNFPAFAQTWMDYEIQDQATGNEGKRIRVKYSCMGYDPEG